MKRHHANWIDIEVQYLQAVSRKHNDTVFGNHRIGQEVLQAFFLHSRGLMKRSAGLGRYGNVLDREGRHEISLSLSRMACCMVQEVVTQKPPDQRNCL